MNERAKYLIDKLQLVPHPEGGYFREIFRSGEIIEKSGLPARYNGNHSYYTSIYFLLEGEQISKFHRLRSDEIWHFYEGCPVKVYQINEMGELTEFLLGNKPDENTVYQALLRKNIWFGAELVDKDSFALIGCTVSPGFEYQDFELAERSLLLEQYPLLKDIIKSLT
jgi:uncharacterized protein